MKNFSVFLIASIALSAMAQTYVAPYIKKDGTYVEGHYKTKPNSTDLDNYGTKGNYNPYSGQEGTKQPSYLQPMPKTDPTPTYGQQCGYSQSGRYVCR